MKKVLAFVLVLSMILGSFGMAFAAAPADVEGKDYEDAVNVLMELGVVTGYKDGTYRPENIVTRAEMATLIIKAMGLDDYAVGKSDFSDMAGHWADPYVAYAASLGFVKGNTDGTFAPDATVTYDQTITMLVQAVGYKGEYLTGGYPGAFVAQAKTLGMLDGVVSGAAGANRGDVATLLFNTLDVAFVRYDNEGSLEQIVLKGDKEDTMLQRLGASEYNNGEAFVVVGTEKSVINLKEYQGAYVKAYQNKDGKIIAMKEVASVFVTGDVDVEKKTFTLADDTEYKLDRVINKVVAQFENGAAKDDAKLAKAEDVTLAVELSGKYVDELYSVAKWVAAGEFQWTETDAEELAEEDTLADVAFAMTDDDEIDMDEVVLVGVDALEDIEEDDIVTYYVANSKIVKVEVSKETVEGEITKVSGEKYTINGKQYKATDAVELALSDEGTFYLNAAGKIAAFEGVSEEKDYAVVVKAAGTDSAYDDTEYLIKLMTEEGNIAIFTMTKTAYEAQSLEAGDVIEYVLNADGEIKSTSKKALDQNAAEYKKGLLDGYKIAEDVFVFTDDADDVYALAKVSDIPANQDLADTVYMLNDKNVVVVIYTNDAEAEDGIYGVVTGAGTVKIDDETVWEIDVMIDGVADVLYYDGVEFDYTTTLYAFTVSGDDLTTMAAVGGADYGVVYAVTDDGNIQFVKNGKAAIVAEDVVVYLINKDGDLEASKLSAINKDDLVWMYEMDAVEGDDDKDGYDIIIYDAE